MRDAGSGLPSGKLLAKSEWHPLLKDRLLVLLQRLETDFSLTVGDNIGQKLANRALLDTPIIELSDPASGQEEPGMCPWFIK